MGNRLLLALAIHRAPRLGSEERLLLWDILEDQAALASLSRRDVEAALSRSLAPRKGRGGRPPAPATRFSARSLAWNAARATAEDTIWDGRALLDAAERDAESLLRIGARFVVRDEAAYPAALRETCSPPFGLFLRGHDLPPCAPAVAIVGTRCPTGSGLAFAAELARSLAAAGVSVVSGLARGIDAAAHRGALEAAGATCAVLPCGIDRAYPPANRALASEILDRGGLVASEYPPGTELLKSNFPERNRIIAGLSRSCVVVEAPAESGALITADHALAEGRDVWVARPRLGGPRSAGIDRLASEGAPALDGAEDLLEDWGMPLGSSAFESGTGPAPFFPMAHNALGSDLREEGRRLAVALGAELGFGDGAARRGRGVIASW